MYKSNSLDKFTSKSVFNHKNNMHQKFINLKKITLNPRWRWLQQSKLLQPKWDLSQSLTKFSMIIVIWKALKVVYLKMNLKINIIQVNLNPKWLDAKIIMLNKCTWLIPSLIILSRGSLQGSERCTSRAFTPRIKVLWTMVYPNFWIFRTLESLSRKQLVIKINLKF